MCVMCDLSVASGGAGYPGLDLAFLDPGVGDLPSMLPPILQILPWIGGREGRPAQDPMDLGSETAGQALAADVQPQPVGEIPASTFGAGGDGALGVKGHETLPEQDKAVPELRNPNQSGAIEIQSQSIREDPVLTVGGRNEDLLDGGASDDRIFGAGGDDVLRGRQGNDELHGGRGHDELRGGTGQDLLDGGSGSDDLRGHRGDDVIAGGRGRDHYWGGSGSDTFIVGADSGRDRIHDFTVGTDWIDLSAFGFSGLDAVIAEASQRKTHVLIELSETSHLRLDGISVGDLTVDDFLF